MQNIYYHIVCPSCKSDDIKTLKNFSISLSKCGKCKLVFSKNIPNTFELEKYYSLYTYENPYYISPITLKRYKDILKSFEKYRKVNRILDVGCGNGIFLSVAKEFGWNCYGVEFSEKAVEICRKQELNVFQGTLKDVYEKLPIFDVIVSIEVIEHLAFPAEDIMLFNKLLRQGGLCYVTTPNFNSLSRYLLRKKHTEISYPEHLTYFTKKSIKFLFKHNNYKIQQIQTTGISFSRIISAIYKTKKENPFTESSVDERFRKKIEQNKILYLLKSITNKFLSFAKIGNTIKIYSIKK